MKFAHLLMTATAIAVASPALAAPTIFFGENQNPAGGVSGAPVTARNQFLAALTAGVSTENFDARPTGSPPIALSFTGGLGTIGATLTGGGNLRNSPNTGAYATSGTQFYDNEFNAFTISFNTAIAAFGFYGTDIGDINRQLQITLDAGLASERIFNVNNTLNANNGSLLFWGITDTAQTFTSVSFAQSGADRFGFDDLTVGDVAQVTGGAVPEPATWAMMIGGFGMVGSTMRYRRRKTTVSFA
jgi:hypothetical protein